MADPIRTSEGDLVTPVALFGGNPAAPLQGADVPGRPIRTDTGNLVARVAVYEVEGGAAVPVTKLGSDVGTDLTADAPLQMQNTGDGTGTISISTDEPGGVPTLDQNALLRLNEMPISGLNYHGAWNASTNTPTLADGVGTAGDFYRVSVAGTQDLGSGPIDFEVGDHVLYEGTTWQQLDPAQAIDWGDIQGTLANQADLQAALDAKLTKGGDSPAGVLTFGTTNAQDVQVLVDNTVALTVRGGQIVLPTAAQTRKVVLYLAADNDNEFHGFGVDANALRYQVDRTTSDHVWYAATGPTASDELFRVQGTGQILVPAGYTPATDQSLTTKGYVDSADTTAAGTAQWGSIGGTLANQGDLTTALGGKLDTAGGTLTGDLHMSEQKVVNVADGTNARDAVNKQQLDAADLTTGGTIDGTLNVTGVIVSQNDVNAQRDVTGARYVNAAFAFSTPTDGSAVPDPATNGVNIYGRDDGGQHLLAQWQDGTTSVIAHHGTSLTQAAHVPDADPTSLATLAASIDAIRDSLVAAGLMASS